MGTCCCCCCRESNEEINRKFASAGRLAVASKLAGYNTNSDADTWSDVSSLCTMPPLRCSYGGRVAEASCTCPHFAILEDVPDGEHVVLSFPDRTVGTATPGGHTAYTSTQRTQRRVRLFGFDIAGATAQERQVFGEGVRAHLLACYKNKGVSVRTVGETATPVQPAAKKKKGKLPIAGPAPPPVPVVVLHHTVMRSHGPWQVSATAKNINAYLVSTYGSYVVVWEGAGTILQKVELEL